MQENNTSSVNNTHPQLKIASLNLFNYLEPPNAFYQFERIYSQEQWQKKQHWIKQYLSTYLPDVIGFQEVFSIESLKSLLLAEGYHYFQVVDQATVIDDFIYHSPVVAIASRFPIIDCSAVAANSDLTTLLGINKGFDYSRKVLRATIDLPHIGYCDCYVVHLKSKRPLLPPEYQSTQNKQEQCTEALALTELKLQILGGWAATIQRGSEASLLMVEIINRKAATQYPFVVMGDFNNNLIDGVLSHLLTDKLNQLESVITEKIKQQHLRKYYLYDAWQLFTKAYCNEQASKSDQSINKTLNKVMLKRKATHYYGATGSVLDYILLSCEFDASYDDSFFLVSDFHTYDKHLIKPNFEQDGDSSDHAAITITLTLRS